MRRIAVIGSGPAGYSTAEAAFKRWGDGIHVDVLDRLPVPFGLIRSGVALDHQSIKAVSRRYESTALADNVRFVGNVNVGAHVAVAELRELYDAVVLATGAPADRPLGVPGDGLPCVIGSAAFGGWYNGHFQPRRPRAAAGRGARGDRGRGQRRARPGLHPRQVPARVRRLRHRRSCAGSSRRLPTVDDHRPSATRPAPDRDNAKRAGRAGRALPRRPGRQSRRPAASAS